MLRIVRDRADAIGCAVSFGKDSLATLDMCCRIFNRVEGYYLYRVANMDIVAEWAADVKRRWGVAVRQYPHFDLSRCYEHAVFRPHMQRKVPKIDMADIEQAFRKDASIDWIAYGWRRNDSFSRALIMKACAGMDFKTRRVFPIRSWRRQDVYKYLSDRSIPLPNGLGRKDQGGLDFHPQALLYLKNHYPRDWDRWRRDFPFAEAQILKLEKSQAAQSSAQTESGAHPQEQSRMDPRTTG